MTAGIKGTSNRTYRTSSRMTHFVKQVHRHTYFTFSYFKIFSTIYLDFFYLRKMLLERKMPRELFF